MRSLIIAALVVLPALGSVASADEARMSPTEFARATQCLAYSNLAVLQDDRPDMSALEARLAMEFAVRPVNTKNEVRRATQDIRSAGAAAVIPLRVQRLKSQRTRACRPFMSEMIEAKN